jgi:hypothetical protein
MLPCQLVMLIGEQMCLLLCVCDDVTYVCVFEVCVCDDVN